MAASNTDKFKKVSRKWVGQVGAGGVADGVVTTVPLASATNLPTGTGVVATINRVDANGTKTASAEESVIGVVSGSDLISCTRGVEGTAQAHDAGDVVEILITAKGWNDMVDGFVVEHGQDGTHDATKIAELAGAQTFTGAKTFTTGLLKAIDVISGSGTSTFPTSSDTLVARATTDTLTNKRITKRVVTTTDDATAVIDVDVTDVYELSAVANATVFTLTGTPTDGQTLIVRAKDAGVAKGLTWTGFTEIGVTLPTTTVVSKWHIVGCIYNDSASQWQAVAVVEQG